MSTRLTATGPPSDPDLVDLFDSQRWVRIAWACLIAFALALLVLGGAVHLPVAVVAPGTVIAEGARKPVAHLEGGIVKEVLVSDGEAVRAGQVLVRMRDVRSGAASLALEQRNIYLSAMDLRLAAEEENRQTLRFPTALAARAAAAGAEETLSSQLDLFEGRRRSRLERIASLDEQSARLAEQVEALVEQEGSARRQADLSAEELSDYDKLVKDGYGLKVRLLELQRRIETLKGAAAEARANQAATRARIRQLRLDREGVLRDYVDSASARRAEIKPELAELEQRRSVATDVVAREAVLAPVNGTVFDLKRIGPGSVIAPGETILEIVPGDAALVSVLRVEPESVESLRVGDRGFVRLFSRLRNQQLEIEGAVSMISADRFEDAHTGRPYYAVHLRLDSTGDVTDLRPGLAVDGFVLKGRRTPLSMILQPLLDEISRGLSQR